MRLWFPPRALARGYPLPLVERLWKVIEAFASFGFCKAHAAAFALPTYQSAWLKTHWPAHFLAGVLTHDPGMYPKRLILEDARQHGIAVLGARRRRLREGVRRGAGARRADGYGIRLALAEVKGINDRRGGADRRRPALPVPHRLLAPRAGVPADRGAAGADRGLRPRSTRSTEATAVRRPGPGHPARPAAPGRRAGAAREGRREGRRGAAAWALAAYAPAGGRACRRRRAAQQHRPPDPGADRGPRAAPARPPGRLGQGRRAEQGDPAPRRR